MKRVICKKIIKSLSYLSNHLDGGGKLFPSRKIILKTLRPRRKQN